MRPPFSYWKPGGSVFDPATLALSGWWRASYAGPPWAAVASAGVSATTGDLVTNGDDPTTGAAQNGLTPADFDGAGNHLTNTTDAGTLFTTTGASIVALIYATFDPAPGLNVYEDPAIYCDANGDFGMNYTASGVTAFAYDGAYQQVAAACGMNAYHAVRMRHDGTDLGVTIDADVEQTTPCTTLAILGGGMIVGAGYLTANFYTGRILELMTLPSWLDDTDFADIKSYWNSRYALALP